MQDVHIGMERRAALSEKSAKEMESLLTSAPVSVRKTVTKSTVRRELTEIQGQLDQRSNNRVYLLELFGKMSCMSLS